MPTVLSRRVLFSTVAVASWGYAIADKTVLRHEVAVAPGSALRVAAASGCSLARFSPGVATLATTKDVEARLGGPAMSDRLFCSGTESPAKHVTYVNTYCYPKGVLPVISVKNASDADIVNSIRSMKGPGLLIIHHEPFPKDGDGFSAEAPAPGDWANMQIHGAKVLIPAINKGRVSKDKWAMCGAFHGYAFKYDGATVSYAAKFRQLGGPQAYRLAEVFNLPGYIPGVDAYDSGSNPTADPLGGAAGPAERMEALVQFCVKVAKRDPATLRVAFPEFGTYANGNFAEACQWLDKNRAHVTAACAWDHTVNANGADTSLTGAKLVAFRVLLKPATSTVTARKTATAPTTSGPTSARRSRATVAAR